jgi:small subunit ribosomal protein S9
MVTIKKAVRDRVQPEAKKAPVVHGVGRRKSSVARVWCYRGKGDLKINGHELDHYFHTHATRSSAVLPLTVVPHLAKHYDIEVNVQGGGLCAQADAIKLGIARAFLTAHEDAKSTLRSHDLLTVDGRVKERKKPGQKAARAKFQFVKR